MKEELILDQTEVFDYLDTLRLSGITNMWGAPPYIEHEFDCSKKESVHWFLEWMETFK